MAASTSPITNKAPTSTRELIGYFGKKYGLTIEEQDQMWHTIWNESGDDQTAHNLNDPYGGAIGTCQFLAPTFYSYAPLAGIKNPDINNREHQIQTMAYMFSLGEAKQWTEWRKLYGDLRPNP